MKIQIKSIAGSVLFEGDFGCLAEALKSAVRNSADLSSADLSSADLSYADLSSADLSSANLSYANLSYADLSYADLSSANLSSANLSYANLSSAKHCALAIAMTRILPEGELIGWKKCCDDVIVKVKIASTTKRSSAFGRKCRAEKVEVLELSKGEKALSLYDNKVVYRVGEIVQCDKWCDDFTQECGGGIHFYITKEEAENHQ